jgi:hypothetical protein
MALLYSRRQPADAKKTDFYVRAFDYDGDKFPTE